LRNKWIAQGGRGFYTRVPLKHIPTRNWVVSLERLQDDDNGQKCGYTIANVVLEVIEANHGNQKWSKEIADFIWGACPY
jgi:hypothetical protein